jgi:glycolate oxidase FAD binding subunit
VTAVTSHEPADAEAAAAILSQAASSGLVLLPHGNRTKLEPPADGTTIGTLSTMRLTDGLAHYAGDLVATAPAGCTLRDVNAVLAREGQWLPLDPPFGDRATIGGIVACNDSGPRRHRFGSPRDLIIGIEVALANGRVAHSGGRVVKNVAGYDLARLFCGSRGSLGLITSVTFKLAPTPRQSRTVVARFSSPQQAAECALALSADASITPTAVEIIVPDPRLLVRFESTPRSAEQMAASTAARLASSSGDVAVVEGDADDAVWEEHHCLESAVDGLGAVLSVLPTHTGAALADVERIAAECGITWSATGRVALGHLHVRAAGGPAALRRYASALRGAVGLRRGHVLFNRNTSVLDGHLDPFGSPGSSAAVGFAVKQRFDPAGVLPYPWARS